jgi:hypothetical protein
VRPPFLARTARAAILFAAIVVAAVSTSSAPILSANNSSYVPWPQGPASDPAWFPIAVWLQAPANARRYQDAGFNTYIGLWQGPTEEQLTQLKTAGMKVICQQNVVGLQHTNDPNIICWMHDDEPDNAQSLGARLGWSAPIKPETVVANYQRMRDADPSRPILLNLGQGVAWDGWYGRGTRKNHPEDYPEYVKGCDIASFDIYPVNSKDRDVTGSLWLVAQGVERLRKWGGPDKIVWNCLECVRNGDSKPTPHQVRCEAWMSLIHGSKGLIYFVHQFKPKFIEPGLLQDPEMLAAVTRLNREILSLAPALNSPSVTNLVSAKSSHGEVPVATMTKRLGNDVYVFAVAMRDGDTAVAFSLKEAPRPVRVDVLGEDRELPVSDSTFKDAFRPWDVHLYKITAAGS